MATFDNPKKHSLLAVILQKQQDWMKKTVGIRELCVSGRTDISVDKKHYGRQMRTSFIIILLLTSGLSFSQDSTVTWIKNIDTSSFKMLYNKKDIPKEFYRVLNVKDINKLANPTDKYSPGCTNPIRGQLHWIAKQKNRWVICVTYGGKGVHTRFYFLDKEKGTLNINEINFPTPMRSDATFGQVVASIKSRQYEFEEYDADQYKLEED